MPDLYRYYVSDSSFNDGGITVWPATGELVFAEGQRYVKFFGGSLYPAEGFVEDKAAAYSAAADRVETLGRLLLSQAERMRAGGES